MIIAWLIGHSIGRHRPGPNWSAPRPPPRPRWRSGCGSPAKAHDRGDSIGIIAIQAGSGLSVFDASPAEARDARRHRGHQQGGAVRPAADDDRAGAARSRYRRAEAPLWPGARPGRHRAAGRRDPGSGRAGRGGMTGSAAGSRCRPITCRVPHRPGAGPRHGTRSATGTDRCLVWIDQQDGQLVIEVTHGRGGSAAGNGYGITGHARDVPRAARRRLLGAGPRPGGGFRVAARLPVPAPDRLPSGSSSP